MFFSHLPPYPQALKPTIEKEEVYTAMVGQGGATPAELFDKFVDELQDKYAEDKRRLRDLLPRSSPVTPEWTDDDFIGRIEKALVGALLIGSGRWASEGSTPSTRIHTHNTHIRTHQHTHKPDAHGESEEENKRLKEFREMLSGRPKHVKAAFKDLHARAVKE